MGLLSGVRVIEFEGLGPAPFCGMLLADLGAEVIVVERPGGMNTGAGAIFKRGKRSIVLDLKNQSAIQIARDLIASADALIEGLRPGVMERLGLGPDDVREKNKKLVYGRLTGWGQDGPLATAAGHDINYVSLSSAAWYSGVAGEAPLPPPTLVGDVAGGSLYLAIGILSGIINARVTNIGCVVDAAIVDGSAHMMNLLFSLRAAGGLPDARGNSMLDGAHFYAVYKCADAKWISIGALEPKFYADFLARMGLDDDDRFASQYDQAQWPVLKSVLAGIFQSKPRAHWDEKFLGTDVCYAPVLTPEEAAANPHMQARNVFQTVDGVLQTAPAPRFDGKPAEHVKPAPAPGENTEAILTELGYDAARITELNTSGVI